MNVEQVLFYLFALGAIAGCAGVVLSRNPINSAVSLVAAFFFLAGNYVLLHANFMAIVQILVYAGAIMVLFLFVLMLLNQRDEELGPRKFSIAPLLGMFAAAVVSVSIGAVTSCATSGSSGATRSAASAPIPAGRPSASDGAPKRRSARSLGRWSKPGCSAINPPFAGQLDARAVSSSRRG